MIPRAIRLRSTRRIRFLPLLAQVAQEEDWAGEVRVFENREQVARSIGGGYEDHFIVQIWWD